MHAAHMGIGTVVGSPFLINGTCREDAGQVFFGDADTGVGLAVLQQHIVPWVILLDEEFSKSNASSSVFTTV